MQMQEILGRKGRDVVTISEDRPVLEAARTLVKHAIGSLVVTDGSAPVGIITERDILRLTAADPTRLGEVPVSAVMTRDLVTAEPGVDLHDAMAVMTHRRVRHLPVVENRELRGIVSIGDLLNACLTLAESENAHLRQYIQGVG